MRTNYCSSGYEFRNVKGWDSCEAKLQYKGFGRFRIKSREHKCAPDFFVKVGILRLRRTVRFAQPPAALRMTVPVRSCDE
jgi:hypothetical protein